MNTSGKVEGAIGGSWKDEEEDFGVRDRVMLRHPTNFYGFFGRKARKGWDEPFMIKKVRPNREIVI